MIVVWRGYGIWVPIIVFGAVGAAFAAAEHSNGMVLFPSWLPAKTAPLIAGLAVGGLISLVWGWYANRGPARQAVDRLTGLVVSIGTRHSLYGVPMQYWGALALVLAAFLATRPPT